LETATEQKCTLYLIKIKQIPVTNYTVTSEKK